MPDDEMSLSDAHSSRSENEDPDWSPPANGEDDDNKGGDSSPGREEEEDNMEPDVGNLDEQAKPPAVGGSPCQNRVLLVTTEGESVTIIMTANMGETENLV